MRPSPRYVQFRTPHLPNSTVSERASSFPPRSCRILRRHRPLRYKLPSRGRAVDLRTSSSDDAGRPSRWRQRCEASATPSVGGRLFGLQPLGGLEHPIRRTAGNAAAAASAASAVASDARVPRRRASRRRRWHSRWRSRAVLGSHVARSRADTCPGARSEPPQLAASSTLVASWSCPEPHSSNHGPPRLSYTRC